MDGDLSVSELVGFQYHHCWRDSTIPAIHLNRPFALVTQPRYIPVPTSPHGRSMKDKCTTVVGGGGPGDESVVVYILGSCLWQLCASRYATNWMAGYVYGSVQ